MRIVVVTPGLTLVSLDARTGHLVQTFGDKGTVDLRRALGRGSVEPRVRPK